MSKILIVDDNRASRDLLRAILKYMPCEIIEGKNGQEALDLIERKRPDVVLLDIDMPVLDGLSVVRKVREDLHLTELPVVAVTSFAMQGDRDKAMAAGFTAYITKPVRAAVLREQVFQLLGHSLAEGTNGPPVSHSRRDR